ncbi:hypothetical protein A6A40_29485 (plasmid) [Azospirillum humicireducens]|uniref:Calcium-binding protein n=1 Tax=Azospirillum humicireducens TaxID=1226968 RepID=A0A2R4VXB5_9PROT|nr:calcium-binding protein [Azospirillum humicireducens]AWB09106.1 hypothetical protein A6A40_29485 [Azospirillum humicireducens]
MTVVSANIAINLAGYGDTTGIVFDNYYLTSQGPSHISFRYTSNNVPVLDASITGWFSISDYGASGTISSLTASLPGGRMLLSFTDMDLRFYSIYSLASSLNQQTILSGNDQIFGSSFDDTLYGYSGNDYIGGGNGNDLISGGYGTDTLDGGDNTDTVISNQYYAAGKLIAYGERAAVLDRTYGSDILSNVEYVRFYDRTVAASSAGSFDALSYLAANRDLAAAFGINGAAAFSHYVQFGYSENRSTSFNAAAYLAANRDLAAAFGTDTGAAMTHYITHGRLENRITTFNSMSYLAANPDLIRAFGADTTAAAMHYARNGRLEGRSTSFNAAAYLARNPDVQRALGSSELAAATHYVTFGLREGRATAPLTTTGRAAGLSEDTTAAMIAMTS